MMEKKIKDLTEAEFQLICKHYGGDCAECPLVRVDEGAENDRCAYQDCQEYIDVVDACRDSIIIRLMFEDWNPNKTYYLVEYYKNNKRHEERFETLDEANVRQEELLKEFDDEVATGAFNVNAS